MYRAECSTSLSVNTNVRPCSIFNLDWCSTPAISGCQVTKLEFRRMCTVYKNWWVENVYSKSVVTYLYKCSFQNMHIFALFFSIFHLLHCNLQTKECYQGLWKQMWNKSRKSLKVLWLHLSPENSSNSQLVKQVRTNQFLPLIQHFH